ncbi:MAG: autotransporter outer membrane beta-barrel domain-containing protein [Rhodanobacteraceae bacterium]
MQMGRNWLRHCLLAALSIGSIPIAAASQSQLIVVHKGGHANAFALSDHAFKATAAACDDDSVVFAFVVAPADGVNAVSLHRGTDTSRDINLELTLTCSNIDGRASIPFDGGGGNAVRGTDYTTTPGVASLPLSVDGTGLSAGATVSVQVLDGSGSTDDRSFNILRQAGSFEGQGASGTPIVGVVPGSSAPIVVVTITGGTPIDEAAGLLDGLDPAASQVAQAVQDFCQPGFGGGADQPGCAATRDASDVVGDVNTPSAVRDEASLVLEHNLLAISPDETTALAFNGRQLVTNQESNLSQRLTALHSRTASGASLEGLTLINDGIPLSLGGLGDSFKADTLKADDDDTSDNQANEEKRTLLGGTRWGVWANGTLGRSERDRELGNAGFDNSTYSLTGGADYRFTNHFFLGAAIGLSRLNSTFGNDQGSLDADARSLHVYSGYTADSGLALDGSLSYTSSDYDLKRVIELYQLTPDGLGFTSLGRDIASSSPSVRQFTGSVGLTYTIIRNVWTFAPQAQLLYIRSDYSAFSETGPSAFNLDYAKRSDNGTSFSAGIYVDRSFATTLGAFRPYSRLLYYADSGGSPDDLFASFVVPNLDGSHTSLRLAMAKPDSRYGTIELGMGYSRPIGTRTVDFNIGAMELFDSNNLRRWGVRLDARIPF